MIVQPEISQHQLTAIAIIHALGNWIIKDIEGNEPIYPDRLVEYRLVALAAFDSSRGAVSVADFVACNDFLCESEHDQIPEESLCELLDLLPEL